MTTRTNTRRKPKTWGRAKPRALPVPQASPLGRDAEHSLRQLDDDTLVAPVREAAGDPGTDLVFENLCRHAELARCGPSPLSAAWTYSSFHEFLQKSGTRFRSRTLIEAERDVVKSAIMRAKRGGEFQPRACFANAARLVLADDSSLLRYVEGEALAVLNTHHAWVTINDKVIDVTWSTRGSPPRSGDRSDPILGQFGPDLGYVGAQFDRQDVERLLWHRSHFSGVLWSEEGISILKTGKLVVKPRSVLP